MITSLSAPKLPPNPNNRPSFSPDGGTYLKSHHGAARRLGGRGVLLLLLLLMKVLLLLLLLVVVLLLLLLLLLLFFGTSEKMGIKLCSIPFSE